MCQCEIAVKTAAVIAKLNKKPKLTGKLQTVIKLINLDFWSL